MEGLRRVVLGQRLQAELDTGTAAWSEAAQASSLTDAATALAEHSGWDAADLEHAMGPSVLALSGPADLRDPEVLAAVHEIVELVRRTGVRASSLTQWLRPRPTRAIADALQSALKARYDDSTWSAVMTPIADRLRVARRDALLALILGRGDFPDDAALYEHYLVDPQMDACMLTSRLRLATSAVQLFVQRVLMNLEQDDVVFPPATAERWTWMKTYRVWEANRKVFFYPENWIEPELRDDKTPLFEQLEQHLQQGELTDEHVEAGY
ncbi:MAG: neuraminidase-like domain-containing protein, partial [Nannocystaceae bacterium]